MAPLQLYPLPPQLAVAASPLGMHKASLATAKQAPQRGLRMRGEREDMVRTSRAPPAGGCRVALCSVRSAVKLPCEIAIFFIPGGATGNVLGRASGSFSAAACYCFSGQKSEKGLLKKPF